MIGRFFEGPLMAAYGAQFGAAPAGAAGFGGVANLPLSIYIACHPTLTCTHYLCHSIQFPCLTQVCTRTVFDCTALCPAGPGAAVGGQAAAMAAPAAAAQMLPSLVCSYAPHCWFSYGACPTMFGCGPFHTPGCPQFQAQEAPMAAVGAQAGAGAVAGTYAPHCWYSWNACPTMFGCGPHHTPACPQFQAQAQDPAAAAAAQAGAVAGTYAPHCWYSWNACPTMYGCGPHHTPACPQFQAQAQDPAAAAAAQAGAIAGTYAPHCWYSWNACPTMYGCGPHHTPACPQFQAQAQDPAAAAAAQGGAAAIAGSYAPHCWYSWNACPTLYGCGPHHTPACPQFR
jgi:hypothetical protein